MKRLLIISLFATFISWSQSNTISTENTAKSQEEQNKQIALNFYEDLWNSDNTDKYADYVANTYIVHDIGDRKNVVEPAIEQKIIADRFWDGGTMHLDYDWQIAEGDLVATRWTFNYKAESFINKLMYGDTSIPIINVFRIKDGKIVEIWNHRHDIDTNMTIIYSAKGFLIGLLIALIPTIFVFRLRKKLKRLKN
ncbi:MAG: ester cyclase [Winogradskyella sp.]